MTVDAVMPKDAVAERQIVITNPSDGSFVGAVDVADAEDVNAAVARARRSFPEWRSTTAATRAQAVRRAAEALNDHVDELARCEHRETGRHREQDEGGIRAAVDTLMQYSELGPLHRGRSLLGAPDAIDLMRPEPRGVAAVVTPWNDPVAVSAGLIGAALVTGNVVIHKPSERCPHVGRLLGEILADCLPAGVLATLIGDATTGEALVSTEGVALIAHVGSSRAGEQIARAAARTGAHVVRENGGNDALIVDDGVDAAWAASETARGAFVNSGQLCTAVERVLVHRDIAEDFLAALASTADDLNERSALAPLVDARMRQEVHAQVAESVAMGASVRTGGRVPDGAGTYYPATVLDRCTAEMPVFRAETFGPVAPVMVVEDFDAALAAAAADEYGLSATVLTADMSHAHRATDLLPVGTVKINDVFGGAPGGSAQPRGRSGSGFGYGPELLDEMTTTKVIHMGAAVTS